MSLLQHFILTRFNIRLWNQDKNGQSVRTADWLVHRFTIFEKYCFPSIINQSCGNFEWIVLFDSETPQCYKEKIDELHNSCNNFVPVYVRQEHGRYFAQIFRKEVLKRLNGSRVLTTYLDNDDALHTEFVKDIQERAKNLPDDTFICYTDGVQYYTDMNLLLMVHYPRNHFQSVVESGLPDNLKTIYGYGSHYYIDKIPGVSIEFVNNRLMWCEVIHDRNMGNDAYFLFKTKMLKGGKMLQDSFSIDEPNKSGIVLYLFKFIPRYVKTFIRRIGYFFFCRKW